jgi:hypothetical protein
VCKHLYIDQYFMQLQELMTNSHVLMNKVRENTGAVTSQSTSSAVAGDSDRDVSTPRVTRVPIITLPLEGEKIPSMRMLMNSAPPSARFYSYSPRQGSLLPMRRSLDQSRPLPPQVCTSYPPAAVVICVHTLLKYADASLKYVDATFPCNALVVCALTGDRARSHCTHANVLPRADLTCSCPRTAGTSA